MKNLLKKTFLIIILSFCSLDAGTDFDEKPTLRYKIAQMLIIGFHDSEVDESSPVVRHIVEEQIGGVILFNKENFTGSDVLRNIVNPQQLKSLNDRLQQFNYKSGNHLPLIISIDQEGGRVNRLFAQQGFNQENITPHALGMINRPKFTCSYARDLGAYIKNLGINLNFAPVVDLARNKENFIFKRKRMFSGNSQLIVEQANAYIEGMHASGVLTTLKHFPGHGSSRGDTHKGFVDVTDTWSPLELEPYNELISEGFNDFIMTAHCVNRRLDPNSKLENKRGELEYVPATFSYKILTELLRKKMNFEGVIITDDLVMGAVANEYTFRQILKYAVNAGADMLILANHQKDVTSEAINVLEDLVTKGEVRLERTDEAFNRIRIQKKRIANGLKKSLKGPLFSAKMH